ncbi:MAG: DUF4080 domain-containing protein, partial [Bacilli bacterium]
DPTASIVADLMQHKPDVIGFSCYIWNIEETMRVIEMIKKIQPDIHIVVGGPEVSYDVREWLERFPYWDTIVIGEGERTFKRLLNALSGEEAYDSIDGIGYMNNGKAVIRPLIEKMDLPSIPSPYRFEEDLPHLGTRITYVETSRGCPFSCQFCLSSIEVGVRYFHRERMKEDLRYLMDHGAKLIKFVDRTFNISRSYAMDMFGFLIEEHRPGVVFQFEITADIMRPEVIAYLNKHAPKGLFRFEIGVQSTNDRTNELVKRKQNFDKLTRTVTLVRDGKKIDQHLDLIAGLPDEDYHSFQKTFDDVFALRPEELQLGFLKMLRGTGLRLDAKKYGYVFADFAPYEILRNDVLSYDDMIRIKQAEDTLEKFWNSGRFRHTLTWLFDHAEQSPFGYFQSFGSYWESERYAKIGYQLEDLFQRIDAFTSDRFSDPSERQLFGELLTLDYYLQQKFYPRKHWSKVDSNTAQEKQILHQIVAAQKEGVFEALPVIERDIFKLIRVHWFSFDVDLLLREGVFRTQAPSPYAILWGREPAVPKFVHLDVLDVS